jgi:hypothetical protein
MTSLFNSTNSPDPREIPMTGLYRINHGNTVFRGRPGTMFRTQDGPLLKAALLAGAVSRVDVELPDEQPTLLDELETSQGPDVQEQPESVVELPESGWDSEGLPETEVVDEKPKKKKG